MQIGEAQFSNAAAILVFILTFILIIDFILLKNNQGSYSIKYKLMNGDEIFKRYPLLTGFIQFLYKLFFVLPVLLVIVIAVIQATIDVMDLPIILVNGLIILLITFSCKRELYFYRIGALWILSIASQFVNLFIQGHGGSKNYYQLLCSIFYPINCILFCLALLSTEKHYYDISYQLVKKLGLKTKQDEEIQDAKKKDYSELKIEVFKDKYVKVPKEFDGGLFGYLRRGEKEKGRNYKFTVLYLLSLCVLGVNAVTVWKTSDSVLGIIGLVTNFIYDLFIFAFNNLDTPQRSVGNVFILVFVGRFLSFAFGEELWIFGFCILYFFVGIFVGQIIINDRLPLRNFNKEKKKNEKKITKSENAFKTPQFVLFILTAQIICLVAASSFGIASSRTNVSYSEDVAVPLWQFAILMVGATWIVILILASIRIFRRYQNKIKEDTEYYFGSKLIQKHHIFGIVTYLLIISVGIYCKYYLHNQTAFYACIFLPAILITLIIFISFLSNNNFSFQQSKPKLQKKKSQQITLQTLRNIESKQSIKYSSSETLKSFFPYIKGRWIQQQKQILSKNIQKLQSYNSIGEVHNQHDQKQGKIVKQFVWTILVIILLFIGLVFCTYFLAQSIFGIFIVICLLSILSMIPFYRYAYNEKYFSPWEYVWYQFCFVVGITYWSFFHNELVYAMVWGGLNLALLSLLIAYGLLRKFELNYMPWLIINFVLTIVFISLLLAFTVPPFQAILVSSILFLASLAALPQFFSSWPKLVKKIIWAFIGVVIIGESVSAFALGFVSNFTVFTFVMGFIYLVLMTAGGISYFSKQKKKYESPHVYSAYGLPIFKFDSKNQKIQESIGHKLLLDMGSATLIIYGAMISLMYKSYKIAIMVIGFYLCTTFCQTILFSIKTYMQLGQKRKDLDNKVLLECLQKLENKYMVTFKESRQLQILFKQKAVAKQKASDATTPATIIQGWKRVAQIDKQLISTKKEVDRLFYFWLLLLQFHIYTKTKADMVQFINNCQQIQSQLINTEMIQLQTLKLAFDFQTKHQLLKQEINNLSPSKFQAFNQIYDKHVVNKEKIKEQQLKKGQQLKKIQYQKEKILFENLEQQKSISKQEKINEFNSIISKLGDKQKYQDRDFPPNQQSLGTLASVVQKWRRPLSKEDLIRGDISPYDVRQGNIGDCYLISSLGVLGRNWILPALGIDPQSKEKRWQNRKGAFMIRFFKFGKEIFITIDDFLPVDQHDSFVFAKSEDQLEIWPCILEKAYAKLYGGYQNIIEGQCHRVLSQLSGGVPFELLTKDFESNPYSFWQKILNCIQNEYLMAAGSNSDELGDQASSLRNIVFGHAYSILDAKEVENNKLIKLKNPHGSGGKEWNGDFSDESQYMDERMKQILKYESKDDGIFWMKLQDFMHEFRSLYICKVFGDKFKKFSLDGQFTPQNSYGTPSKSDQTFRNPQYGITVKRQCTVFVNLTQQDAINNYQGKNFIFMRIQMTNGKRISRHNKSEGVCGLPQKSKNNISVTTQVSLEADSYPYTYTLFVSCAEEGDTGKYKLDIYCTDKEAEVIQDLHFDRAQFN